MYLFKLFFIPLFQIAVSAVISCLTCKRSQKLDSSLCRWTFRLVCMPFSTKDLDRRFNCNNSYCATRLSFACAKWSWDCVSRDAGLSYACVAGSWRAVRSHASLCWSHNAWLLERKKQRRGSCRGNVQKRHHYTVPELFRRRSILDYSYKVRALTRDELRRVTSKWGANATCLDFIRQVNSWRKLHKSEPRSLSVDFMPSRAREKIKSRRWGAKKCYYPKWRYFLI